MFKENSEKKPSSPLVKEIGLFVINAHTTLATILEPAPNPEKRHSSYTAKASTKKVTGLDRG